LKGDKVVNVTPIKLEILKIFYHYQQNRPYSPTMRELADLLQRSRATVFEHCAALQEKGFLCASRGKARSLKLTEEAVELIESVNEDEFGLQDQAEQGLPLVGMINAGLPGEALESSERISLETEFAVSKGKTFALQVSGESMINDNICPGDYVVCRQDNQPRNGDVVVAIVDGNEATLKRFYKEKNHIRLQPANDNFQPIITRDCQIRGVVVGLIRKI
jgi:repressor LexA